MSHIRWFMCNLKIKEFIVSVVLKVDSVEVRIKKLESSEKIILPRHTPLRKRNLSPSYIEVLCFFFLCSPFF